MSEVQEICRLLDERGIRYETYNYKAGEYEFSPIVIAFDWADQCSDYLKRITVVGSCISAEYSYLTPKMAVDALTCETCHNVAEMPEDGFWPMPHFTCSACGASYVTSDYVYFCPSCGRRVIEL